MTITITNELQKLHRELMDIKAKISKLEQLERSNKFTKFLGKYYSHRYNNIIFKPYKLDDENELIGVKLSIQDEIIFCEKNMLDNIDPEAPAGMWEELSKSNAINAINKKIHRFIMTGE